MQELPPQNVERVRAGQKVFDDHRAPRRLQVPCAFPQVAVGFLHYRCRILRRFQEYSSEFPWTWRPVDLDDYMAERRSGEKPISLTTLRSDSNAIAMFCAYASSSSYGWGAFCEQTFGDVPAQIAFEWNTPRHTTDDAMPPGRRAFTQKELQKLFDYMDDLTDELVTIRLGKTEFALPSPLDEPVRELAAAPGHDRLNYSRPCQLTNGSSSMVTRVHPGARGDAPTRRC